MKWDGAPSESEGRCLPSPRCSPAVENALSGGAYSVTYIFALIQRLQ